MYRRWQNIAKSNDTSKNYTFDQWLKNSTIPEFYDKKNNLIKKEEVSKLQNERDNFKNNTR